MLLYESVGPVHICHTLRQTYLWNIFMNASLCSLICVPSLHLVTPYCKCTVLRRRHSIICRSGGESSAVVSSKTKHKLGTRIKERKDKCMKSLKGKSAVPSTCIILWTNDHPIAINLTEVKVLQANRAIFPQSWPLLNHWAYARHWRAHTSIKNCSSFAPDLGSKSLTSFSTYIVVWWNFLAFFPQQNVRKII